MYNGIWTTALQQRVTAKAEGRYLLSHESYHWAEIGIILNEAGLPLDQELHHQLWQWW